MCRFTNVQRQLLVAFESILQRVDEDEALDTTQGVAVGGDELKPAGPFQEHLPCTFAYVLVSSVVPDFSREDVCAQAARGSGAVVSGVHC